MIDGNKPVVMTITLNRNGSLTVDGPLSDKRFALALLDFARAAVQDMGMKSQNGLLIPAKDVSFMH